METKRWRLQDWTPQDMELGKDNDTYHSIGNSLAVLYACLKTASETGMTTGLQRTL